MGLRKTVRRHIVKSSQTLVRANINKLNLPHSILIIPDGNARWAKAHHEAIGEGHTQGAGAVANILEELVQIKTKFIGIWGFSEDNWKRPQDEINHIFKVIHMMVETNLPKFQKNDVKFLVLGKRERLGKEFPHVLRAIEKAEIATAKNTKKVMALFVDYGERYQLEEFAKARVKDKKSTTYELLSKINKHLPLFELVIRTSGEQRLSGFGPLASIAEFVPIKKNLPDLKPMDIINVLQVFSSRKRRFGGRDDVKKMEIAYETEGALFSGFAAS